MNWVYKTKSRILSLGDLWTLFLKMLNAASFLSVTIYIPTLIASVIFVWREFANCGNYLKRQKWKSVREYDSVACFRNYNVHDCLIALEICVSHQR